MPFDGVEQYEYIERLKELSNVRSRSLAANSLALNRFRLRHPDHELENTIGYVFFTKPDLNLFDDSTGNVSKDIMNRPEFHDVLFSNYYIVDSMTSRNNGPFLTTLFAGAENFELIDENMKIRYSGETSNDWRIAYGGRTNESRTAGDFSIGYSDDRNLSIYKTHALWVDYIDLISIGAISPSDYNRANRILDYACSVYFFLCSEDGETVIFYSKYTGVFPKHIPSSALSWTKGEAKRPAYTIQYQYSCKKDMDPLLIKDFNNITGGDVGHFIPIFDIRNGVMGSTWAKSAYIETDTKNRKYKLRFTS